LKIGGVRRKGDVVAEHYCYSKTIK